SDCEDYVRHCDMCQRHVKTIHCPTEKLCTLIAPYPFLQWAMDIIGLMPSLRQRRLILVLTDYLTKWIEAESYISITDTEVHRCVWRDIIRPHCLPKVIVADNGSQFISSKFCRINNRWKIRLNTGNPRYPLINGYAESSNKTII